MSAVEVVNEIDLSDENSLQRVLEYLDKQVPGSLCVRLLLKNIQRGAITKEHLWPHRLYVNDPKDIQCVLFVISTIGFRESIKSNLQIEQIPSIHIRICGNESADNSILSLIEKYAPWPTDNQLYFSAIDGRFSEVLRRWLMERNISHHLASNCNTFVVNKDEWNKHSENGCSSIPEGIQIRRLSKSDAETVNNSWTYKSAVSLHQILFEIEHFPCFGAYRNDDLIGWCLARIDGSIGALFTKPEERRLGLGRRLIWEVTSNVLQYQDYAIAFVLLDNLASNNLFEKLGFRKSCSGIWIQLP